MQIQLLKPLLFIFGIILPAWIMYRWIIGTRNKINGRGDNFLNELMLSVFVFYVSIVLEVTIVPASISGLNNPREPALNVIPVINTYKQFIYTLAETDKTDTGYALENIIGNILLFIPLGMLLPYLFPAFNSIRKLILICLLSSLTIELTQFILRQFGTYRTVDIDDIILNTTGGILGWLIYTKLIAKHLIKKNKPLL